MSPTNSVVLPTGATMVYVPLRPERDFHLDPADVEAAVTPATRSVMINTPHNPTGAAYHRARSVSIWPKCAGRTTSG